MSSSASGAKAEISLSTPAATWPPVDEAGLAACAVALGADGVGELSAGERALVAAAPPAAPRLAARLRDLVRAGGDPLGDALCTLRTPEQRRPMGATYTPAPLVDGMVAWLAASGPAPARVVDPGCGSGRFLLAAARAFPKARLVGVELDPLAALLARANAAAAGLGRRVRILVQDFRTLELPASAGPTAWIGNPPYVRHHQIDARWKRWLTAGAAAQGLPASQLAGLHVHFVLAIARQARPGDRGTLITAAEWLDVNYGALVRRLLLGPLGLIDLQLIEPTARPFPDAATTAAITGFVVGSTEPIIGVRRVATLARLGDQTATRRVARARLAAEARWTPLTRATRRVPAGHVELGELCRVHRGQVTGANRIWIAGEHSAGLPARLLLPCITRALELFRAGAELADASALRRVIALPVDLGELGTAERRAVERFLVAAKAMGGDRGFIASHRQAWWAVGLRAPAPILATYMARRPPAFVRNRALARHINIAHGLYPRVPLDEHALGRLAAHLARTTSTDQGRTYAGGLTKFEPREMERLVVPSPELLAGDQPLHG